MFPRCRTGLLNIFVDDFGVSTSQSHQVPAADLPVRAVDSMMRALELITLTRPGRQLLNTIRDELRGKFGQKPQLAWCVASFSPSPIRSMFLRRNAGESDLSLPSSSHELDLNLIFAA